MLKKPNLDGAVHAREFIIWLGGIDRVAKLLEVHPATVRRWKRDGASTPQAALQAMYWLTHYGFSDAYSSSHFAHMYMCGKVRRLEAKEGLLDLETISFAMPSNAPVYAPRPRLRLVPAAA